MENKRELVSSFAIQIPFFPHDMYFQNITEIHNGIPLGHAIIWHFLHFLMVTKRAKKTDKSPKGIE